MFTIAELGNVEPSTASVTEGQLGHCASNSGGGAASVLYSGLFSIVYSVYSTCVYGVYSVYSTCVYGVFSAWNSRGLCEAWFSPGQCVVAGSNGLLEHFPAKATELHYTALSCTALHCTDPHCTALSYTQLHCI